MNENERDEMKQKLAQLETTAGDLVTDIADLKAELEADEPVPWYEETWREAGSNIYSGGTILASVYEAKMTKWIFGSQELASAVRDYMAYPLNDGRMRKALQNMGEDV